MTDVLLSNTPDGGEIEYTVGRVTQTDGPETAIYLSLFGGNEDDVGDESTSHLQWWGNHDETDPSRQYRSRTQSLIAALPSVPANLRRIEEAVAADLQWMLDDGIAVAVNVTTRIPSPKRIAINVEVFMQGVDSPYVFDDELDWIGSDD